MGEDCVFCRIVDGQAEASIVFEDATTLAFIDVRQFHPGHTLVVPKRHIPNLFDLDDDVAGDLARTLTRVARAVRDAFKPDGMNVWQSNGVAGGQEVFHLHLHILPRAENDGMLRFYPSRPGYPQRPELDEQAARIRAHMVESNSL
jgi:histidine triad (HIT) family protein